MRLREPRLLQVRPDASSRPSPGAHRLPLLSTKCGAKSSPADDGATEGDERAVDVVADLPADAQAAEPVQQRDRSFHDPAVPAQAGAVPGAAPGDARGDLEPADLVPVDLVVIAAVGVQILGAAQWPAALAADRRDGLDQRDQLGDVVAVTAGGDCRERDAVRLDDQVVLAAGLAPVPRGRTGGRPPFSADVAGVDRGAGEVQQVCGPQLGERQLVQALPDPGLVPVPQPASRSSPSRSPTSGAETPSGSRCTARTGSRIAHLRLSRRLRPGRRGLRGTTGSSGSMRAHNLSSISHARAAVFLVSTGSHPFGQHQRELTHRHSRRSRNLLLSGVVREVVITLPAPGH
ncbi:hypothetical protein Strvi_5588 [Streptomyces violaceusniger Tu 4113]|uniref:Uncharacterized protein n=1 Tax=Streptomyces violaceusniger (strain Tu 4113) TaxID=653045 RepID=G2PFV2_STRV4|nr:hypothetical protein Strvi_5588 [Streptomyces violaceusniger Tu 4113]